jgi:hypothetical protein
VPYAYGASLYTASRCFIDNITPPPLNQVDDFAVVGVMGADYSVYGMLYHAMHHLALPELEESGPRYLTLWACAQTFIQNTKSPVPVFVRMQNRLQSEKAPRTRPPVHRRAPGHFSHSSQLHPQNLTLESNSPAVSASPMESNVASQKVESEDADLAWHVESEDADLASHVESEDTNLASHVAAPWDSLSLNGDSLPPGQTISSTEFTFRFPSPVIGISQSRVQPPLLVPNHFATILSRVPFPLMQLLNHALNLIDLTTKLPLARQRGHEIEFRYLWEILPIVPLENGQPGYEYFRVLFAEMEFQGLRMVCVSEDDKGDENRLLCVFGCKKRGSICWISNYKYFSNGRF